MGQYRPMSTSLATTVQSPTPGVRVALYRLDATVIGGPVIFFVESMQSDSGITFGGQYYTPVDVAFTDFETNATGSLPTPKMKLSNTNGVFQNFVNTYGDMLGCTVSRIRTFAQFLDNGAAPDPSAFFGPDIFRVQRKANENKVFIEWELSAAIDQDGKMLPGRQMLRDTCLWRYRVWTGSSFDYSKAQCPYSGTNYFDVANNPVTDASKDVCARTVMGCKSRFGSSAILPFGGFPGIARVSTS